MLSLCFQALGSAVPEAFLLTPGASEATEQRHNSDTAAGAPGASAGPASPPQLREVAAEESNQHSVIQPRPHSGNFAPGLVEQLPQELSGCSQGMGMSIPLVLCSSLNPRWIHARQSQLAPAWYHEL